jgi:hypothetical protein
MDCRIMVLRCGQELGSNFHLFPVLEGEQAATDPFHPPRTG